MSSVLSSIFPSTESNQRCQYRDCILDVEIIRAAESILDKIRFRRGKPPRIDIVESNEFLISTIEPFEPDVVLHFRELGWVDSKKNYSQETVYEYRKTRSSRKFGIWTVYLTLTYFCLVGLFLSSILMTLYAVTGIMMTA